MASISIPDTKEHLHKEPADKWASDTLSALDKSKTSTVPASHPTSTQTTAGAGHSTARTQQEAPYIGYTEDRTTESAVSTPGLELPGAFPRYSRTYSAVLAAAKEKELKHPAGVTQHAETSAKHEAGLMESAREYIPTTEQELRNAIESAGQTVGSYLPESVRGYLSGASERAPLTTDTSNTTSEKTKTSLPSQDDNKNLGKSGGVGSLPGEKGESGVARLPEEKKADHDRAHQMLQAAILETNAQSVNTGGINSQTPDPSHLAVHPQEGDGASSTASTRTLAGSDVGTSKTENGHTSDTKSEEKTAKDREELPGIMNPSTHAGGLYELTRAQVEHRDFAEMDKGKGKSVDQGMKTSMQFPAEGQATKGEMSSQDGMRKEEPVGANQKLNTSPRQHALGREGEGDRAAGWHDVSLYSESDKGQGQGHTAVAAAHYPVAMEKEPPTSPVSDRATAGHGSFASGMRFDSDRATDGHEPPRGMAERMEQGQGQGHGTEESTTTATTTTAAGDTHPGGGSTAATTGHAAGGQMAAGPTEEMGAAGTTTAGTGTGETAADAAHHQRTPPRKKAGFMDMIKGEVKVLSGKLANNDEKVEKGRRMMGKN